MSRGLRSAALAAGVALALAAAFAAENGASDSGSDGEPGSDTAAEEAARIDTTGLKPGCFYARDVQDWEVLNREYMIVYAPNRKRSYLVNFSPPSYELRNSTTLGFTGRDRLCGRAGERIVTAGGMGRDYFIVNIWRLDAATAERIREDSKQRGQAPAQPAIKSPGAEIEPNIEPNKDPAATGAEPAVNGSGSAD